MSDSLRKAWLAAGNLDDTDEIGTLGDGVAPWQRDTADLPTERGNPTKRHPHYLSPAAALAASPLTYDAAAQGA